MPEGVRPAPVYEPAEEGVSGTARLLAYCTGAVFGACPCPYPYPFAVPYLLGDSLGSARSIVIGVIPCTLTGDTLLGFGELVGPSLAGSGKGGTPFSPGTAVLGASAALDPDPPLDPEPAPKPEPNGDPPDASSLPNKAFVFGADTTRLRKRAAAEFLSVPCPLSGDFLVLDGGSLRLLTWR